VKWRCANTTVSFLERPQFDERLWRATRNAVVNGYHGKLEGTGWMEFTSEDTSLATLVLRDKRAEDEMRGRHAPRPFIARNQPSLPARPFVAMQQAAS
jgi:hypothetical protein